MQNETQKKYLGAFHRAPDKGMRKAKIRRIPKKMSQRYLPLKLQLKVKINK